MVLPDRPVHKVRLGSQDPREMQGHAAPKEFLDPGEKQDRSDPQAFKDPSEKPDHLVLLVHKEFLGLVVRRDHRENAACKESKAIHTVLPRTSCSHPGPTSPWRSAASKRGQIKKGPHP